MNNRIKIILIITKILILLGISKVYAVEGNFSVNKNSETLNVGQSTTFLISATNCGGKFTITSSNPNVVNVDLTEDWIENSSKEVKITAKSKGTATITIKAEDVSTTDAKEITGSKEIKITVLENENSSSGANNTTANNSNSSSNNNNKPTTQEKSSEARLKDFRITPNGFSGFKRDTYEYNVEVPNNVAEVEVYARTLDSNAKIKSGTGKISLKEGQNKAEVVVVAEDGKTTKTYTLNITRQSAETPAEPETEPTTQPTTEPTTENTNEEKLGLSSLTVNQMNLKPNFSTDTYEYTIELTQDLNSLEIEAKSNKDTAIVEIFGNENLQQGENLITIIVSDTSSEENTIYQITVNKNLSEKEVVSSVDWLDPATWGFKQYLIVGTVIVLIIIIIIAIILKIKLSKMDDEDDIEFPGVKELDKAMSEHQELTNSEEENKKEVKNIEPENYDTKQKLDEFFNNEEKESTPKKKGKHF